MPVNRIDESEFRLIASELGLGVSEVRRAVSSFFAVIASDADSLPFDNARKIYSREKFKEFVKVRCIPYVGRIGPVYSRYLKWRANEAKGQPSERRSSYRTGMTRDEIEHIAASILAGRTPQITRKKNSELFNRVWLVGKDGKKSARQVIPKEKTDVQD